MLPPVFYGAGEHQLHANRYMERIVENGADTGAIVRTYTQQGCIPIETVEYREQRSKFLSTYVACNTRTHRQTQMHIIVAPHSKVSDFAHLLLLL